MATGYSRQSSAEIVDGQVIMAADFNNEFNAILAAFHATTGHDHSGGTGLGPTINLTATTPGVSGILASKFGGVHTAAADPTSTDDTPDHQVGSIWVNTTTDAAFVCVDNTSTAAIWHKLPPGTVTGATTPPTTTEDIADGYKIGSIIVNTTQNVAYFCTSAAAGAATWVPLGQGKNGSGASAPTTGDDANDGYALGSTYVDTTTNTVYICKSPTAGAAVWISLQTVNRINPLSFFLGLLS